MDIPSSIGRPLYPLTHFIGYRHPPPAELPVIDPAASEKKLQPVLLPRYQRFRAHKFTLLAVNLMQTFIGTFGGTAFLVLVSRTREYTDFSAPLVIGSFGATALLLYAVPAAPFSQPKNVILGNVGSAVIGVGISKIFGFSLEDRDIWAPAGLSVAVATLFMQLTDTIHPPAGAAAVLATASHDIVKMGWFYVLDVLISCLVLTAWALIINNLGARRYPAFWTYPAFIREEHKPRAAK